MKTKLAVVFFILLPVVVLGSLYGLSRDFSERNREVPTQMQYSPASLSYTENPILPEDMTLQTPPSGTVRRGFLPLHYQATPEDEARAGKELVNPFQPTPENIARGKYIYTNTCAVCHGTTGVGDGPIAAKYMPPTSYKAPASIALPDGAMFHIITYGRNNGNMPPHAAQVLPDDRWKVILYIRTLQKQ
ncbi:MAG: cytochrome c [Chloracidobacterium sp.]|nr:cytochrome c [Chloracidobacterium sp.]MCC6824845.1 cytochrome c [Acidobacteriota bacterium]